jgi:hypothetical protein
MCSWGEGFELRNMEDGVDLVVRRQVELVRQLADSVEHLERPEELVHQLGAWAIVHRRLGVWLQLEEDGVADFEGAFGVVEVRLLLEALLGAEDVLS